MTTGDAAPQFSLPDTDGVTHALGAAPSAVVFTCNHCPYALAWHDRLLDVARDYQGRARVLLVNPNDAERYPRDSFEAMKRARGGRRRLAGALPARRDAGGRAGLRRADHARRLPGRRRRACCATAAPRTRDYEDPAAGARWLRDALDAVLEGREPDPAETEPVGCSVKWSQ